MLISCGGFANYRAETHFFDLFVPRYGSPRRRGNRRRLADAWLESQHHARTGLPREPLRQRLLAEGCTAGAFLATIMESLAEAQGCVRWADSTPAHLRYMRRISRELPDARFVHVIRDGRDVALSLAPRGWTRPLPWDRGDSLLVAAWTWEWNVTEGRRLGGAIGNAYREVRFESLVQDPERTIQDLGSFLEEDLDPDRLETSALGSVSKPNTTFKSEEGYFDPVGRWRRIMPPETLDKIERTIGPTLRSFDYDVSQGGSPTLALDIRHRIASGHLRLKQLIKDHSPLARVLVDPGAAVPPQTTPPEEA